jgi:hypothetical protein
MPTRAQLDAAGRVRGQRMPGFSVGSPVYYTVTAEGKGWSATSTAKGARAALDQICDFYGAGSPFVARVEKLANKIADELLQHEEA